eukprot:6299405-Pyramimonas_sp.AAC.1
MLARFASDGAVIQLRNLTVQQCDSQGSAGASGGSAGGGKGVGKGGSVFWESHDKGRREWERRRPTR